MNIRKFRFKASTSFVIDFKEVEFRTLKNIDHGEILDAFNRSFQDYFVPLQLTIEQLEQKIFVDNIVPELSAGAFDDNGKLIGFVLHGQEVLEGKTTIYNSGTGVIKEHRGRGISRKLYDHALPGIKQKGADKILLEVIEVNLPAIQTYNKIGFRVCRELECYSGTLNSTQINGNDNIRIEELNTLNWPLLQFFWDWRPSWQNLPRSINKMNSNIKAVALRQGDQVVGYGVYNPNSGRVLQFAVHKMFRRKGLGTIIFKYIHEKTGKELSMINIDSKAVGTLKFLQSLGFKSFARQLEMELIIKN